MISFADLTNQVHTINDMILSDMVCDPDSTTEEALQFSKHLLATKLWFGRISYLNKKRYILVLLHDVRSAWTLSVLLKSLWNCRPKDAVMSVNERGGWYSSYDQVPMDHNRTALPVKTLAMAMKNDRLWFISLTPEEQALVLSELLTIAGGPVVWEVLSRAQTLYDRYEVQKLQSLRECVVVGDALSLKSRAPTISHHTQMKTDEKSTTTTIPEPLETTQPATEGEKNLAANLALWDATIKNMRESLKLEEFELTFLDGNKRKIWKVLRPKPDITETVDFVQLLPSAIGKRILSFLPRAQLGDYARVNKYWAYLVEELRSELAARIKIDADISKFTENLVKHDETLYEFIAQGMLTNHPLSSIAMTSTGQPGNVKQIIASVKASEKSGAAYSLRYFSDKLNKPKAVETPIRNMADLNERMERRGATDENIWNWCGNIVAHSIKQKKRAAKELQKGVKRVTKKSAKKASLKTKKPEEKYGIIDLGNVHFPCPLMKHSLDVPLDPPLFKDPAMIKTLTKPRRSITNALFVHTPPATVKRYSLWTRDVSPLYPVFKIPSYQFPDNLLGT